MATEADFGIVRGREPSPEVLERIVQLPNEMVIKEFGDQFHDVVSRENDEPLLLPADVGKFVAAHTVLLMAPFPRSIAHADIIKARPDLDEEMNQVLAGADKEGIPRLLDPLYKLPTRMTDAGWFSIGSDRSSIKIFHSSGDFGRADIKGRIRTVESFQRAVGDNITVLNDDETN